MLLPCGNIKYLFRLERIFPVSTSVLFWPNSVELTNTKFSQVTAQSNSKNRGLIYGRWIHSLWESVEQYFVIFLCNRCIMGKMYSYLRSFKVFSTGFINGNAGCSRRVCIMISVQEDWCLGLMLLWKTEESNGCFSRLDFYIQLVIRWLNNAVLKPNIVCLIWCKTKWQFIIWSESDQCLVQSVR